MSFTRRKILKTIRDSLAITALTGGVGLFIDNLYMSPVAKTPGEILCDLHAHPANYKPEGEIIEMLTSPGLVGLGHNNLTKRNLTYEGAIRLLDGKVNIEEITPHLLAKVGNGYFLKAQELSPDDPVHPFEILALGVEGRYLDDGSNTVDKIKEIHDLGGIAIIVDTYVQRGGPLRYRLLNPPEEKALVDLVTRDDHGRPDAVEAHSAQLKWWVKSANKKATELSEKYNVSGVSSSDAHRRTRQVKLCGVGIASDIVHSGIKGIQEAIRSGNFTRKGDYDNGPYVSAFSFGMGHFYEQTFGGRF